MKLKFLMTKVERAGYIIQLEKFQENREEPVNDVDWPDGLTDADINGTDRDPLISYIPNLPIDTPEELSKTFSHLLEHFEYIDFAIRILQNDQLSKRLFEHPLHPYFSCLMEDDVTSLASLYQGEISPNSDLSVHQCSEELLSLNENQQKRYLDLFYLALALGTNRIINFLMTLNFWKTQPEGVFVIGAAYGHIEVLSESMKFLSTERFQVACYKALAFSSLKGQRSAINIILPSINFKSTPEIFSNIVSNAVLSGSFELFEHLFIEGGRAAVIDEEVDASLAAAYSGQIEIMKYLFKIPEVAELYATDLVDPLQLVNLAIIGGSLPMVNYLFTVDGILEMLIEEEFIPFEDNTALTIAASVGDLPVFKRLLEIGEFNQLFINNHYHFFAAACESGNIELVDHLLEFDFVQANFDRDVESHNNKALMNACLSGVESLVKKLLQFSAVRDHMINFDTENTALYNACISSDFDTIAYLLEFEQVSQRIAIENNHLLHAAALDNRIRIVNKFLSFSSIRSAPLITESNHANVMILRELQRILITEIRTQLATLSDFAQCEAFARDYMRDHLWGLSDENKSKLARSLRPLFLSLAIEHPITMAPNLPVGVVNHLVTFTQFKGNLKALQEEDMTKARHGIIDQLRKLQHTTVT